MLGLSSGACLGYQMRFRQATTLCEARTILKELHASTPRLLDVLECLVHSCYCNELLLELADEYRADSDQWFDWLFTLHVLPSQMWQGPPGYTSNTLRAMFRCKSEREALEKPPLQELRQYMRTSAQHQMWFWEEA